MENKVPLSASRAWLNALCDLVVHGKDISPRDQKTIELPSYQLVVDANQPVVGVPARGMNYSFMAAEALWITDGDNSVAGIAQWNKNIANYSDDGVTFFGAYGPQISHQLDYVVDKLLEDRDTRQAVLTIWRQNPPATKDYPCTVAMSFQVRDGKLHNHVFMRSNDAWLGTVYDIFNFSMILTMVACFVNARMRWFKNEPEHPMALRVGNVYLTAASFHLYDQHIEQASELVIADQTGPLDIKIMKEVPQEYITCGDWGNIRNGLIRCRDKLVGDGQHWDPRPV